MKSLKSIMDTIRTFASWITKSRQSGCTFHISTTTSMSTECDCIYSFGCVIGECVGSRQSHDEKVVDFLSSGGSDYSIPLLKKAGVDMTTSEPFDLTMKKMNRVMDEMEKILDKKKK